jgi:hypothetical protein
MTITRRTAAKVAAWGGAAVLTAGAFTGVAMASDSTSPSAAPSATGTSSAGAGAGAGAGRLAKLGQLKKLEGRALHGEFTVSTKNGVKTFDAQNGQVTAVSATSMTVRSSDGFSLTWTLDASTRVRVHGAKGSLSDITKGATVRVLGLKSGSGATALGVGVPKA